MSTGGNIDPFKRKLKAETLTFADERMEIQPNVCLFSCIFIILPIPDLDCMIFEYKDHTSPF